MKRAAARGVKAFVLKSSPADAPASCQSTTRKDGPGGLRDLESKTAFVQNIWHVLNRLSYGCVVPSCSRPFLLTVVLCLVLLGGGASDGQLPAARKRTLRIGEKTGSVSSSGEDRALFVAELDKALYEDSFARGDEFTLLWRITRYDPGSRAVRYFSFGAGKGYFSA